VFGPELPSTHHADAASQLHQTGHSSMAQHFRRMKVGSADIAAVDDGIANVWYVELDDKCMVV